MSLAEQDLVPYKDMAGPLAASDIDRLSRELGEDWKVVDSHHLESRFEFDDFEGAMDFADDVGDLAEEMGHHPDICFGWGYCQITIWTHKVGGLSVNDFIFAARVAEIRE
jgi:4a-hydroxytetrahydrobiopterin dehydratase